MYYCSISSIYERLKDLIYPLFFFKFMRDKCIYKYICIMKCILFMCDTYLYLWWDTLFHFFQISIIEHSDIYFEKIRILVKIYLIDFFITDNQCYWLSVSLSSMFLTGKFRARDNSCIHKRLIINHFNYPYNIGWNYFI